MTSRKRPVSTAWAPPPEDKLPAPATLPADFAGWDDAEAVAPAPKPAPRIPSWQEAIFPNRTAAGGGIAPLGLTALGASAKDLAALPVNVAAGLMNMINYPMQQSVGFRRGMAGAESDAMPQNERAVMGLSMAGGPLGKVAEASVPAARAVAPLARGLANIGRGVFGGVAESAPAAAYQAATGDGAGSLANLALGGAFGGGMRTVGLAPKGVDKAAGNMAGGMSGIPEADLRKIGFLGNSEYGRRILEVAGNRRERLNELGREFLDRAVTRFDDYLPNAAEVDGIIASLPDIKTKSIIDALERSKTAVKIKGKPGSVTRGSAEVFDSPSASEFKASTSNGVEVFQDLPRIGAPGTMVPFSNVTTKRRPGLSGLLGMDEKGLPAVRRNPQVIPDVEPVGSAGYSVYQKGTKGKAVNAVPEDRAADRKIDDLIQMVKQASDVNGYIPATAAREIRKRYDAAVGDAFGKESSAYISALKNGRHEIAQVLESAAEGTPYAQAMRDYTKMYRARDKVFWDIGSDAKTQEKRIEAYLSNLFQGNKTANQKAFKEFSDLLGEDFAGRAKLLSDAKRIAPNGEIPLVSAHSTGKAGMGGGLVGGLGGLGYGLASGNPALMAASVGSLGLSALGSPALAPGLLWATDRVANMAANPVAGSLARTAGRSGRAYLQSQIAGE